MRFNSTLIATAFFTSMAAAFTEAANGTPKDPTQTIPNYQRIGYPPQVVPDYKKTGVVTAAAHKILVAKKREDVEPKNSPSAEIHVEAVVERLRSFALGKNFNVTVFEKEGESLRKEITGLDNDEVKSSAKAVENLTYANKLFKKFEDSTEELKKYQGGGLPGYASLGRVLKVHLSMLALQNSDGTLNFGTKNVVDQVLRLWRLITFGNSLDGLPNVSEEVKNTYNQYHMEAQNILQEFEKQISERRSEASHAKSSEN